MSDILYMIYYIIAYTLGTISISFYYVYYTKSRRKVFLNIAIFNFNYQLIIIMAIMYSVTKMSVLIKLNDILCYFLSFTLLHFIFSVIKTKYNRVIKILFFIYILILSIITLFFTRVENIIYSTLALVMILSVLVSVESFKRPKGKIGGLINILFIPIIFFFDFFPQINPLAAYYKLHIKSNSILFILFNITLIVALKKEFWNKVRDYNKIKNDYNLTNREIDVFKLLLTGRSYKKIGDDLNISLSTVKTHSTRIYNKTACSNKVELIDLIDN